VSNAIGAALHTAFGGLVGGRVSAVVLPERPVYPCISFIVAGSNPDATLCGETPFTLWRYRIDVYALTGKEAAQICASVKSIMRGFAFENHPILEMEGYEPEIEAVRRTMDFYINETQEVVP
jgi:hypothetical protein